MGRKNLASELTTVRNVSVEVKSVSGESVTVPAGAAGSVVVAQLANFPVRNSTGNDIGGFGDTSLALSASTAFVTEVAFETPDASLTNGQYWVDYIRGEIRGKKASTSTSATAAYKVVVMNMSIDDTDVTLTIDTTGLATSAKQDDSIGIESSIDSRLGEINVDLSPKGWRAPTVVSVTSSSTSLFTADSSLRGLVLSNLSVSTTIYYRWDGTNPVASQAIPLYPEQTVLLDSGMVDITHDLKAITATGTASVIIQKLY